jgi:hypothetical protein
MLTLTVNLWGFVRVQSGPDKGSYYHPLFIKGQRDCCQRLTRVRLKGAPTESKASTAAGKMISNGGTGSNGSTRGGEIQEEDRKMAAIPNIGTATSIPVAGIGVTAAGDFEAATIGVGDHASSSLSGAILPVHGFTTVVRDSACVSAIEAALRSNSQQQIVDILRSQQGSQQLGSPIPGSSMDGVPMYAGETDRSSLVVNGLLQHQREVAQRQQEERELAERQLLLGEQQQQQQLLKSSQQVAPQLLLEQETSTAQQGLQVGQSQAQTSSASGGVTGSDHMAALLSVSAQRRREEELALLLELSKPKGLDV